MALGYAQFDSYDNVGYVLTLHNISPPTEQPLYIESDGPPVQSYAWLKDTDAVLAAAAQVYPTHQGFNTAIQSLCQLCKHNAAGKHNARVRRFDRRWQIARGLHLTCGCASTGRGSRA